MITNHPGCLKRTDNTAEQNRVICDQCDKPVHIECARLTLKQAEDLDIYLCPRCQDTPADEVFPTELPVRRPEDWDTHLAEFQFALNSVIHDATKQTPAAVYFRREFHQPGDMAMLTSPPPHVADRPDVEANMEQQAVKNKKYYDRKRSEAPDFKEGKLVLMKNFPKSDARKKRTQKLEKKLSPLNYQICEIDKPDSNYVVVGSRSL